MERGRGVWTDGTGAHRSVVTEGSVRLYALGRIFTSGFGKLLDPVDGKSLLGDLNVPRGEGGGDTQRRPFC